MWQYNEIFSKIKDLAYNVTTHLSYPVRQPAEDEHSDNSQHKLCNLASKNCCFNIGRIDEKKDEVDTHRNGDWPIAHSKLTQ